MAWCRLAWDQMSLRWDAGYSTLAGGDCDASPSPSADGCSWRIKKVVNTMNASCVNGFLHKAVETRGAACFQGCGPNATNADSDCWIECAQRAPPICPLDAST